MSHGLDNSLSSVASIGMNRQDPLSKRLKYCPARGNLSVEIWSEPLRRSIFFSATINSSPGRSPILMLMVSSLQSICGLVLLTGIRKSRAGQWMARW